MNKQIRTKSARWGKIPRGRTRKWVGWDTTGIFSHKLSKKILAELVKEKIFHAHNLIKGWAN